MSGPFRESVAIVLAGYSQVGKNRQAVNIFFTKEGETFPFQPALFIRAEQSGNVTTARMLQSKRCTVVDVTTAEDVTKALAEDLPRGHGESGEPFRMIVFDGWSQVAENTITAAREAVIRETPKNTYNFQMHSARATGPLRDMLKAWNEATMTGEGALFLSTCHVTEKWREKPGGKQGERLMVGWELSLPPKPGERLLFISSNIIYLLRRLPEIESYVDGEFTDDEEANFDSLAAAWKSGEVGHDYFAITRACKYQGFELSFVKFQDNLFSSNLPPLWRNPDIGAELLKSPLRRK